MVHKRLFIINVVVPLTTSVGGRTVGRRQVSSGHWAAAAGKGKLCQQCEHLQTTGDGGLSVTEGAPGATRDKTKCRPGSCALLRFAPLHLCALRFALLRSALLRSAPCACGLFVVISCVQMSGAFYDLEVENSRLETCVRYIAM